jgi:hypothetical protein
MNSSRYYVLKVKGKAKIPDYIQVRDAQFTLIGYFRPGHTTAKTGRLADKQQALFRLVEQRAEAMPFGIVTALEVTEADLSSVE